MPQDDFTWEYLQVLIQRLYSSAMASGNQEWTDFLFMAQYDGDGWPLINAFYNGDQPVMGVEWSDREDMLIVTEALARCRRALEANGLAPWQVVVISVTREGSFQWKTFYQGDPRLAGLEFMPDTMPAVVSWGRRVIAE